MSVYSNSTVTVTGGTSTYVAGNYSSHVEVHEIRARPVAFERLCQYVATNALHNSGEVSDQPKCHPGTRTAILDHLFAWSTTLAREYPIKWLYGPAGAGKSAILRTIARRLYEERLLLASFFFHRKIERRNTSDYVIATVAYQLALSIPGARPYIEDAIDRNPVIFSLSLWDQALALIVSPLVSVFYSPLHLSRHYPRAIVLDGLDECRDPSKQREVLQVLHRAVQNVPIPLAILVASRPEHDIQAEFNIGGLNKCSSRLALDDNYDADSDIRSYLFDRFNHIRQHHPMESEFPSPWPAPDIIDELVAKASGQFIYAATVDKFISSPKHNPSKRLRIVLGAQSAEDCKPFEQLDNLYSMIFNAVADNSLPSTLRILGCLLVPHFNTNPYIEDRAFTEDMVLMRVEDTRSPGFVERLFNLDTGEVRSLLFDLGSLLAVGKRYENVRFYHASLSDYLFDRSRSCQFWIDVGMTYADLAEHCIRNLLQWPGIRGFFLWNSALFLSKATPTLRLQKAIQEFDFEELIAVSSDFEPHGLRDLCPTLLQVVIKESKFADAQKLFSMQLNIFKGIVAARLHQVYFPSAPLRTFVIAVTFVHAKQIRDLTSIYCFRLSEKVRALERTEGFYLLNATEPLPILPFIQSLFNEVGSDCFISEEQYADAAFNIFKSFLISGSVDLPRELYAVMKELISPLLSKSAIHGGLLECIKKLLIIWKSDLCGNMDNSPVELQEAMATYVASSQIEETVGSLAEKITGNKRLRTGTHGLGVDLINQDSFGSKASSRTIKRARMEGLEDATECFSPDHDSSQVWDFG